MTTTMAQAENAADLEDGWSPATAALWDEIEGDLRESFGDDAEITVSPAGDHLDVRILPRGVADKLEAGHEDLEVVPYNAVRMTVRREP